MIHDVVFIQGGGPGAHEADAILVDDLRSRLGAGFSVRYPPMPDEGDPAPERWLPAIGEAIATAETPVILIGHSIGGYLLLKRLAATSPARPIVAIAIIAAPFPSGDEDWTFDGFELPDDLGARLPGAPVFLYASDDDETVPVAHRALYAAAIPHAETRTTTGGHQLDGDLSAVARDLLALDWAPTPGRIAPAPRRGRNDRH